MLFRFSLGESRSLLSFSPSPPALFIQMQMYKMHFCLYKAREKCIYAYIFVTSLPSPKLCSPFSEISLVHSPLSLYTKTQLYKVRCGREEEGERGWLVVFVVSDYLSDNCITNITNTIDTNNLYQNEYNCIHLGGERRAKSSERGERQVRSREGGEMQVRSIEGGERINTRYIRCIMNTIDT